MRPQTLRFEIQLALLFIVRLLVVKNKILLIYLFVHLYVNINVYVCGCIQ